MMSDKNKSYELKKHVSAIHSSNKLTLLQRKIANALLYNAYDELLTKEEYQIQIKTLCDLIGYDSHDYKTIKVALVNLLATVIEWNLVDGDKLDSEGVWNASSIIADASIEGSVCTYSYSNKMKKLLYRPELYGRLNMQVQAKFKSSYGLALYENCIRYQNIERTPWFHMPIFRKLMGVEENKYTIFRDFKRRVLDKAIQEVNTYSPIMITAQFQKKSREILAIQFLIKSNLSIPIPQPMMTAKILSKRLYEDFGLSKQQITETLATYEESYILDKIAVIEASPSFIQGKIINLAKYLQKALTDDYQPTKSSKEVMQIYQEQKQKKQIIMKCEEMQRDEYYKYLAKQIRKKFESLTEGQKKQILQEFERYLKNGNAGLYLDIYLREGLSDILVADHFCDFIKVHKRDFLDSIASFAEFCLNFSNKFPAN
jgi:plasmid replication initiation protein